jgi:cytochrome c-type biogenesis protein CcsB
LQKLKENFRKLEATFFSLVMHLVFFIPFVLNWIFRAFFSLLTTLKGTVVMLGIFAFAVAIATFIENDFGTPTARAEIYNAKWFEILLIFITINLINIFIKFKMYKLKKWHVSLFHLSFIIIGIGALATRYIGYEGTMTIRENQISNLMLSEKTYVSTQVFKNSEKIYSDLDEIQFSKLEIFHSNNFQKNIILDDNRVINLNLENFLPYYDTKYVYSPFGDAVVNFMILGQNSQQPRNIFLKKGDFIDLGNIIIDFGSKNFHNKRVIYFSSQNEKLNIQALSDVSAVSMDDFNERVSITNGKKTKFEQRKLYQIDGFNLVLKEFMPYAEVQTFSNVDLNKKERDLLPNALDISVEFESQKIKKYVLGSDGTLGQDVIYKFTDKNGDEVEVKVSYGSQIIELPFYLKLRDFQLDRYAGSMSASSYASEVTLIDQKNNITQDHRIFMNNVLDYQGFRFFQSSYTQDEQGTILSVNYDFIGTNITYFGYFIMMLGMFFAIFGKTGRFQNLREQLVQLKTSSIKSIFWVFILFSIIFNSENLLAENNQNVKINTSSIEDIFKFNKQHASLFGQLIIQDQGGRLKPLDTFNIEILTKLTRKKNMFNLTSNQIILGMMLRPEIWRQIKIINIKHNKIKEILGVQKSEKSVAFEQFFEDPEQFAGYKLQKYVSEAVKTDPKERGTFEKDLVKLDEQINVAFMVFTGSFLKIFPNPDANKRKAENNKWYAPVEALQNFDPKYAQEVQTLLLTYFQTIDNAILASDTNQSTTEWKKASLVLNSILEYQKTYGAEIYPSASKIKTEIIYNQLNIFEKGIPLYFGFGFVILLIGFVALFSEKHNFKTLIFVLSTSLMLLFFFYSIGLLLRWYISGHAPWSDAYESLLYIGWATTLAGFIFSKNSPITLGTTTILTGLILFVAHLNFINPQITNLVPVLKSYWLTVHVSLITASYGFLGLGSLLGFMALLLFTFKNSSNKAKQYKIEKTIIELNIINEMNLIVGLFLLTIGNFLGGIWANESWGRYWGWDSKETWSLITILIYTIILHLRFIPKVNTSFVYSFSSLIAFASVLMTYFGVNFYLSGLHSYAQGDPVPIPSFVYYSIFVIFIVFVLAYRNRTLEIKNLKIKHKRI